MNPALIVAIAQSTLMILDWILTRSDAPEAIDAERTRLRNLLADEARKRGTDEARNQDN